MYLLYTDIHCHIIHGIDDGAAHEEMAFSMLRIAQTSGTQSIIATPHYINGESKYDYKSITSMCKELNTAIANKRINLTIYPGCEVFICPELPKLYENKIIGTLAESRYMLIEFPLLSLPTYTDDVIFNLQVKGVVPIIAHPERYINIRNNYNLLIDLVQRGILFQVNSGSITGLYGRETQKSVMKLLDMGLVHFVASDAHNDRRRIPNLMTAAQVIEKIYGREKMEELFTNNGVKILRNEIIDINNEVYKRKPSFWGRLFK